MDTSADVAAIIKQAPDWNFAGDCALLELMKRISQNLEERGEHTINNLNAFETNVRRVDIALDNATNSLRSLQFGQQFVEYRVEEVDDDDFAMPEQEELKKKKPEVLSKSSQEMAKEFLQNNLQMFRKNFEPVTIEVPDSDDDEDGAMNTTTVFRAKNPYDAIPLPYIIGSKDWQEHKYAGLYDSGDNSEDEQPEQFSSSSSSDELEQVKPSRKVATPQQTDSSSLASLPKDQAPSHPRPAPAVFVAAPIVDAQPRPIISSRRNPHERDLFNALRASPPSDDPPSTSSSLTSGTGGATASGLHQHADASLSSSSSRQSPVPAPAPAPAPVPAPLPTPTVIPVQVKAAPAASQIKRPPVNLFNDDAFNSFMSEIVDKLQSKPGKESIKDAPQLTKSVNLFDDSPPVTPKVTATVKALPTSIFDDNLDDDVDFLSSLAPRTQTQSRAQQPMRKPTTLFDDDDDELDIDDIFKSTKPKPKAESKLLAKNWLFEDDEVQEKNIFGATEEMRKQEQEKEVKREQEERQKREQELQKQQEQKQKAQEQKEHVKKKQQEREEEERRKQEQEKVKREQEERKMREQELKKELDQKKEEKRQQEENMKREEELKKQQKKQEERMQQEQKKQQELEKEKEQKMEHQVATKVQHKSLFDDLDDDDLFGTPKTKPNLFEDAQMEREELKVVQENDDEVKETTEDEDQDENNLKSTQKSANSVPKAKLFSDDFSEDDESLKEAVKEATATMEIPTDPREKDVQFKDKSNNLFVKLRETPDAAPDEEQLQQDPMLSLVAATINNKKPRKPEELLQNYSSLFSDEPPDDSEFFQSLGASSLNSLSNSKMFEEHEQDQDFFEPRLPDLPDVPKASAQPVEDYGGLRLFSDVPPEDVGRDERAPAPAAVDAVTTRIHTIFYDDFSETARAQSQSRPAAAADVVDRSTAKTTPTSPVKKLQMPSININVKALLPGAGTLPKLVKLQEQEDQEQEPLKRAQEQENRKQKREQEEHGQNLVKSASTDADNILQCVAKTRARGPAHRRPSTRRARQENYAKSLRDEVDASSSNATPSMPIKQVQLEQEQKLSSGISTQAAAAFLQSDDGVDGGDDDDALFKPTVASVAAPSIPPIIPPLVPPVAAPVALLSTLPPAAEHKTLGKTINSFLDSDDDDDSGFLFSAATSPAAPSNPNKKYVSFLDNEDEDDDKQTSSIKPAQSQVNQDQQQQQQKKKLTSAFLDSDEDPDDNALFASLRKTVPAAPVEVKSVTATNPSRKYVSFLDNEDEDDVDDFQHPPAQFNPAQIQPESKSKASKLFDDSDDDDDDLFGQARDKAKSQPASKERETRPKVLSLKAKLPAKSSKSLFSDDDDDDDLFGGGGAAAAATKRAAVSNQAKIKPINPVKTPAKSQHSSGNSDNPLADLLDP
ncbi:hypothetical protein ACLKA7_000478 [Drosophila subpalustris]